MEEISVNLLVDAKEEYTKQLTRILVPRMYEGISHIYSEAKNLANENKNKTLVIFQNLLKNIPQWNQNIIEKETNRIIEKSGIDWLEDLISAIFVVFSKILSAVRVTNHSRIHNFHLTVPKLHHFIHECYIEMARKFYMNTMLFSDELTPNEQQINVRESYKIVKESIIEAIRILLPVKAILHEYLQASYQEEFGSSDKVDISKDKLTEKNNENIKNMISRDLNGGYKDDEQQDSETDSESDDDDDFLDTLQNNINKNNEKENEKEMNEIEKTLFSDNIENDLSMELPEELKKKDTDENYENEDGISIEIKPKQMEDGIDDNQIKEIKIIDNKKYNDNDTVSNNKEEVNEINTEDKNDDDKQENKKEEDKDDYEEDKEKEKNEDDKKEEDKDDKEKDKNEDDKQKDKNADDLKLAVKPLEFFYDAED